jgi:hypothetical protein
MKSENKIILDVADPKCDIGVLIKDFNTYLKNTGHCGFFDVADVFKWLRTHDVAFVEGRRSSCFMIDVWGKVGFVERPPWIADSLKLG